MLIQTKIKTKTKFTNPSFLVFDIETYPCKVNNVHIPYLLVMISDKETKVWFKKDKTHNIIREFIEHIKTHYKKYNIFAHNLSEFDGRFILDELTKEEFLSNTKTCLFRQQEILAIYLKNNITFKDSRLLLPDSLAKLAKEFNLELSKANLPHDSINEDNYHLFKNKAIEYCILDCQILYKILINFQNLSKSLSPVNPLSCLTLPQFAYYTYLTEEYFDKEWELYKLDKKKYNFIASGYYGGRVDVFQTYVESPNSEIYYYDVNSLYPFAMLNYMPEGKGTWINLDINSFENFFGFVDITIESPSNIHIPILPYRFEDSLYFPKGTFRGVHFSEEIKYALSYGYKIKEIHKALSFEKRLGVFNKYVYTFYEKKKEEAKTRGGLYYIIKLLLNGLYGKFGMRHFESVYKIVSPQEFINYSIFYTIDAVLELKNAFLIKIKDQPNEVAKIIPNFFYRKATEAPKLKIWNRDDRSPVHVSAAIASYSRITLDKCIRILGEENICYCDTDSVISLKELPKDKIDSTALGFWKLEGTFKEFYSFGPKIYHLDPKDGIRKPIDRCKGVPREQITEALLSLKNDFKYISVEKTNFLKDKNNMLIHTNVYRTKVITAYKTKKRHFVPNSTITYPLTAPDDFNK